MAAGLVEEILGRNNISSDKVLVVYGSSNPYSKTQIPSETHQIISEVGIKNIGVHHTNYGCGGYLAGFQDLRNFLETTKEPAYALFVLSDYPSKMVRDYNTAVLFSDAVCVSLWSNTYVGAQAQVGKVFFSNFLDNPLALNVQDGYWEMDGSLVSRFVEKVPAEVEKRLGVSLNDFFVIPHQANPALLATLEEKYGVDFYKADAVEFGNTTCSALFIAIARNLSKLPDKDFLCIGFGDTESYGAFVLKSL